MPTSASISNAATEQGDPPHRDYQRYDRGSLPVLAFAADYPSGHVTGRHQHPHAQLIHAVRGVMLVATDSGQWIVPPTRGIWMPAATDHWIRMIGEVHMRTAYIRPQALAEDFWAGSGEAGELAAGITAAGGAAAGDGASGAGAGAGSTQVGGTGIGGPEAYGTGTTGGAAGGHAAGATESGAQAAGGPAVSGIPAGQPAAIAPATIAAVASAPATCGLPAECRVLGISPLLRELILAAIDLPLPYAADSRAGRLARLLLDELLELPTLPLSLPRPQDARLQRICTTLSEAPDDPSTLGDWAERLHLDPKTIQRLFARETGMSFGQWRQQARLLAALERLARGEKVLNVALELGYNSPSAFATMFRKQFGVPPSGFFGPAQAENVQKNP